MNKYMLKLTTAISSAALIASSFVGPALALNVVVSGNGGDANVTLNTSSNTTVDQNNTAYIDNDVEVDAQTGDNEANFNTGGDTSIVTGNATGNANVTNNANVNWAEVEGCCPSDVNITVKDNGVTSDTDIDLDLQNNIDIDQDNDADIENDKIDIWVDTGNNEAKFNTGGNTSITTGDADGSATVETNANVNGAMVTGSGEDTPSLSILVEGNGGDSEIDVALSSNVMVGQSNDLDELVNDVEVDAQTGDNEAKFNTGGETTIITGDADADADVSNLANFNWADLDACGCPLDEDSTLTIKDNGVTADIDVDLDLSATQDADQDNDADIENDDVEADAETGDNEAKFNTSGDDPTVSTGDADADANVDNSVNVNAVNGDPIPDLPGWIGDLLDLLLG